MYILYVVAMEEITNLTIDLSNNSMEYRDFTTFLGHGSLCDELEDMLHLTEDILHSVNPSLVIVITISVITVVLNIGSLLAISQVGRLSMYLKLVASLSVSHILVGILIPLTFHLDGLTLSTTERCAYVCLRGLKMTSHIISPLNLLGFGLDHYCAVIRPFQHRLKISARTTNLMISVFWLISLLCGFSDFLIPSSLHSHCAPRYSSDAAKAEKGILAELVELCPNISKYQLGGSLYTDYMDSPTSGGFCHSVYCSVYDPEYLVFVITCLLLVIITIIYTQVCYKIYTMRRLLTCGSQRSFKKNMQGFVTTLCVVATYMVCWLPYSIFTSYMLILMKLSPESLSNHVRFYHNVDKYQYALLLLNSLCDPIIYAVRIKEVKNGYYSLLSRCVYGYQQHLTSDATAEVSSSCHMTSHIPSTSAPSSAITSLNRIL